MQDGRVNVIIEVLLQQDLLDGGRELETFSEALRGKVLDLGIRLPGPAEADRGKVREI